MADQRGGVMGGVGSGWHGPRDPAFPARDRDIVELLKGHMTLQDIGDEYGISRERVRQILNREAPGLIGAVKREKMDGAWTIVPCEVCGDGIAKRKSEPPRRACSVACSNKLKYSPVGCQCYELRQQGHSWREVHRLSRLAGKVAPGQNAFTVAKRFAERMNMPWPPLPRSTQGKSHPGTCS